MTLQEGDLLELPALEQSLENFKRVPSTDATMELVPSTDPGAQPGDSDIVVYWSQTMPFRVTLSLDDAGVRSTGRLQSAVTFAYDHWWTLNDLFYVSVSDTAGERLPGIHDSQSRTVHYSLPWRDWLLSITHSEWEYRQSVPIGDASNLYSGTSRHGELAIGRLLYRDSLRKTTGSLRLWWRESDSHVNDAELEQQRRHTGGWEFQLSHRESIGDGTLDASLAYRRGTGAFGSTAAPEQSQGDGSARMRIVRADALLSVPLPVASRSWRYSLGLRAQWNARPLTPQDRFAIGNRYTVRGFDGESLLIGDRGWLVRQEIGWSAGALRSELYAGVDTGHVGARSSETFAGHQLTGAVIGVRGVINGYAWDGFIGRPLSRPDGFRTAATTAGFNLSASF
jgi:hemolysin activation/secretion protein